MTTPCHCMRLPAGEKLFMNESVSYQTAACKAWQKAQRGCSHGPCLQGAVGLAQGD